MPHITSSSPSPSSHIRPLGFPNPASGLPQAHPSWRAPHLTEGPQILVWSSPSSHTHLWFGSNSSAFKSFLKSTTSLFSPKGWRPLESSSCPRPLLCSQTCGKHPHCTPALLALCPGQASFSLFLIHQECFLPALGSSRSHSKVTFGGPIPKRYRKCPNPPHRYPILLPFSPKVFSTALIPVNRFCTSLAVGGFL